MKTLFDEVSEVIEKAPNFGHYFNTTGLKNPELNECKEKAKSQDELVLAFFQRHEGVNFNWEEVYRYMKLPGVPDSSIKRAISDLKEAGNIVWSGNWRKSRYGRRCRCWKLK